MDLEDARWQTGPVADGRLVSGVPLEADGAVAAIEHDGRLVAAVAVGEHYDGDCPWADRHDRCETYLEAWDLTAGTRIIRIPGAGGDWVSLIVLEGRLQAIVANWVEPLRCWDIASGENRVVVTPPGPVWTMAAGRHRARPVVLAEFLGTMTPSTGDAVIAWDLETGDEVERFAIPARGYLTTEGEYFYDRVRGLAETAAGPVLVTTDGDRDLRLWTLDTATWRGQVCRYEPAPVTAVAVTSQPVPVIAAGYADSTVSYLDPATGDPLASPIRLPEPAGALAFGPSGELAACYGTDVALFPPAVPAAG